jgi:Sulfotransferase family
MVDESRRNPNVAFIHINRTGGSTFRKILQTLYGDAYHFALDPAIPAVEAAIDKYQAVEFHVVVTENDMFMTHEHLAREDRWDILDNSSVFVLFRDPVDYYLSTYHHSIQRRAYVEPMLLARGFKFPDNIEEFMSWGPTFNAELAYFLGIKRDTGYCATRTDLEKAKDLLRRPNFHVGITERFGDFIHILQHETGRQIPGGLILNVNRNPNRPSLEEVPQSVRETIRRNSDLDYELYEFAKQLFLADLARCGPISEFEFAEETVPELQQGNEAPAAHPPSLWSRLRAALGFGGN